MVGPASATPTRAHTLEKLMFRVNAVVAMKVFDKVELSKGLAQAPLPLLAASAWRRLRERMFRPSTTSEKAIAA